MTDDSCSLIFDIALRCNYTCARTIQHSRKSTGSEPMSTPATSAPPLADILIVDDNPNNLRLLQAILSAERYEVRAATSGRRALAVAQTAAPDLVMLDITMPEMDGYEVCRQ